MRYSVRRFKSLRLALAELEPFIHNGRHLEAGKPFKRFGGLRSRELLANWLLCVAVNYSLGVDRLTFTSDPIGGDGVILDKRTGETWPTEHVLIPSRAATRGDSQTLVLQAIRLKWSKGGAAYAAGKTLVVFLNAVGSPWRPDDAARDLPKPLLFEAVWVVGLQRVEAGAYIYGVTRLDLSRGHAPVWEVRIEADFGRWSVEPMR